MENRFELTKEIREYFIQYMGIIPIQTTDKLDNSIYNIRLIEGTLKELDIHNFSIVLPNQLMNRADLSSVIDGIICAKEYCFKNHDTLSEAIGTSEEKILYIAQFINYLDGLFNPTEKDNRFIQIANSKEYNFENNPKFILVEMNEEIFFKVVNDIFTGDKIYTIGFKKLILDLWENQRIFLFRNLIDNVSNIKLDVNIAFWLHFSVFRSTVHITTRDAIEMKNMFKKHMNAKTIRQMIGFASTYTMFNNDNNLINSHIFNASGCRKIIRLLNTLEKEDMYDILDHQKEWKIIFRYLHLGKNKEITPLLADVVQALRNNKIKRVIKRVHINDMIYSAIKENNIDKLYDIVKDTETIKYMIARRVLLEMENPIVYLNKIARLAEKELIDEAKEFNSNLFRRISRMRVELNNVINKNEKSSFYSFPRKKNKTIITKIIDRDNNKYENPLHLKEAYNNILMYIGLVLGRHLMKFIISKTTDGKRCMKELDEFTKENKRVTLSLKDLSNLNIAIPLNRRSITEAFGNLPKFTRIGLGGKNFSVGVSWKGKDLDLHSKVIINHIRGYEFDFLHTHCYYNRLKSNTETLNFSHSGDVRFCPEGGQEIITVSNKKMIDETKKDLSKYILFYIDAYDSSDVTNYEDKFIVLYNENKEVIYKTPLNINSNTVSLGLVDLTNNTFIVFNESINLDLLDSIENCNEFIKLIEFDKPMLDDIIKYAWWDYSSQLDLDYDASRVFEIEFDSSNYLEQLY